MENKVAVVMFTLFPAHNKGQQISSLKAKGINIVTFFARHHKVLYLPLTNGRRGKSKKPILRSHSNRSETMFIFYVYHTILP